MRRGSNRRTRLPTFIGRQRSTLRTREVVLIRPGILALTFVLASGLGAQQPNVASARFLESRPELESLLEGLRQTAASTAYSSTLRQRAREEAAVIERRLRDGDFGVNDRIYLEVSVQGQPWFADTLRVTPGPAVRVGEIGEVELGGVLRSELQEHMLAELSRYLREPRVNAAESFIRVTVLGAVTTQGERHLPAETSLGEALTLAGLGGNSDVEGVTISRGGEVLWDEDAVLGAVRDGRTLDQMSLQAGDEIMVPELEERGRWLSVIQIGIGLISAVSFILWRF